MEVIPKDLRKRSDYLLLLQARLHGWSGTNSNRARRLDLTERIVANLMNGKAKRLSLEKLIAIARKAGITARI